MLIVALTGADISTAVNDYTSLVSSVLSPEPLTIFCLQEKNKREDKMLANMMRPFIIMAIG